MIISSNITGIIADDLTGANDTALQFHINGANTQILLNNTTNLLNVKSTQTWAISTETRNVDELMAYELVTSATQNLINELNPDYFYKKVDSTLRGNIATECLSMLSVLEWDAVVLCPAFPGEGRVTIGGYHLLKGIPIERTEMACDPHNPINESHIPTLLKSQLTPEYHDLIATVELKTIMKGAGPILKRINELVEDGKKLIIMDAVFSTDVEQIALALNKSDYKLLPAGTSAFAHCLADLWYVDMESLHINKTLPILPKLIISGSATNITSSQIEKLENNDDFNNALFVSLDLKTVINGVSDELVDRIVTNLGSKNIVVVHTSHMANNFDGFSEDLLEAELTKSDLADKITDFLSELAQKVIEKKELILITLGGETSYKCCHAIGANQLQLIDEVAPAIALTLDHNAHWIVTKSGNLGGVSTLVDILKYFESHNGGVGEE
ncbi:MAG: four-carbon acid sugar kinase family protein [Candidatus Gastranaerophilales bacterium]